MSRWSRRRGLGRARVPRKRPAAALLTFQLFYEPDEMTLSVCGEPSFGTNSFPRIKLRGFFSGEQPVRGCTQLPCEPDQEIERRHSMTSLDSRDVLVSDTELAGKLVLGEAESFPACPNPFPNLHRVASFSFAEPVRREIG